MSVPDGILMGYVADPTGVGESKHMAMVGSPAELIKIVRLLCLTPNKEQVEGVMNETFSIGRDGPLEFSDSNGSYLTMQPVSKANEFLDFALQQAILDGEDPAPYL